MRPKALAHYEKAINSLFEKDIEGALNEIKKGLDMYRDMTQLLVLRASIHRQNQDYNSALNDLERASKYMQAEGLEQEV